jgi:hypothetical protein
VCVRACVRVSTMCLTKPDSLTLYNVHRNLTCVGQDPVEPVGRSHKQVEGMTVGKEQPWRQCHKPYFPLSLTLYRNKLVCLSLARFFIFAKRA